MTTGQVRSGRPEMQIRRALALSPGEVVPVLVVSVHACVFTLVAAFALLFSSSTLAPDGLVYPASLSFALLFLWILLSWRIVAKTLFDPYVLFVVAAALFNGGQAFLEVGHLKEGGILAGMFPPQTIVATLILVTLGLASLHLGALLAVLKGHRRPLDSRRVWTFPPPADQDLRWIGWGLVAVSFLPSLLLLREAVATVLSSGYFGLFQRETAAGISAAPRVLAGFLVPGALFVLAGSRGRRSGYLASGLVVGTYSAIQFFLGSRSYAVMPLVAYVWIWHRRIRPLRLATLLGSASVVLFLVLPLVQAVRNVSGAARFSLPVLANAFSSLGNPAVAILSEMGASMLTVAHTLELVPSVRNFDLGLGYVYALLTAVPNLFWKIHPTVARGLASEWLVSTVDPNYAAQGGGFGFSFIAEAYLNFGWLGAPLALIAIGFLFAKFVLWAERSGNSTRLAAVGSFLAFFLVFARGESGSIIRPLLWYALIPYVLVCLLPHLRRGFRMVQSENSLAGTEDALRSSGEDEQYLGRSNQSLPDG